MNAGKRLPAILRWLSRSIVFFLLVAFVTTCCMTLFVSTLSDTLGLTLTEDNLGAAAKLTFGNVVLLSLLFSVVDAVRRRLTVERPVRRITEAAERITRGDFSVRIPPQGRLGTDGTFHRITECFNRMAEELSGVETLRADFIANVSHEMKTPLAVMQNYGVLLRQPGLEEAKRIEYAQAVIDSSRRMADLMTNILKLNRLENQQIFPRAEEYDLSNQLCQCLLQYESVWEREGIEIETELEDAVRIRADAELLWLVWSNLLSNAFKFTPRGGRVSLSLHTQGEWAVVCVRDTGCGMSPEVGAHIFEKFYQGDASHAAQGNGLGLALVRRVIDITRGEIRVESAPGAGSAFTVKLRRT